MFLQYSIYWSSYQLSVSVLNQINTIPETQTLFLESGQHDTSRWWTEQILLLLHSDAFKTEGSGLEWLQSRMQTTRWLLRTMPILLILFILESNGSLSKTARWRPHSMLHWFTYPEYLVLLKSLCFPLLFVTAALRTLLSPSVWNQVWSFCQLQTLYNCCGRDHLAAFICRWQSGASLVQFRTTSC